MYTHTYTNIITIHATCLPTTCVVSSSLKTSLRRVCRCFWAIVFKCVYLYRVVSDTRIPPIAMTYRGRYVWTTNVIFVWSLNLKKKSGTEGRGNVTNVDLGATYCFLYAFPRRLDDLNVTPTLRPSIIAIGVVLICNPFSNIVTIRAIRDFHRYYNNNRLTIL